jgi:RNA-directed DNA polymerase
MTAEATIPWRYSQYFKIDYAGISRDRWILSDPRYNQLQLVEMAWTLITEHILIKFNSSPFNPELKHYYEERDIRLFNRRTIGFKLKLAKRQKYLCPLCDKFLADNRESLEVHHKQPRARGGTTTVKNCSLIHSSCHIAYHRRFPVHGYNPSQSEIISAKKLYFKNVLVESTRGDENFESLFRSLSPRKVRRTLEPYVR